MKRLILLVTQVEQIKAKIEKRIEELTDHNCHSTADELDNILTFIDSFPKEPKTVKDIADYCESKLDELNVCGDNVKLAMRDAYADVMGFCVLEYPCEEEPKIRGWVARDKDGQLGCYDQIPIRSHTCWYPQVRFENWVLPKNYFPDLKWEDEPCEVELLIREL